MAKKPSPKSGRTTKPGTGKKRPPASSRKPAAVSVGRKAKSSPPVKRTARPTGKGPGTHKSARSAVRTLHEPQPRIPDDGDLVIEKADAGLSKQELEQFRQALLDKRAEIMGDVSALHKQALNNDRREAAGDLSSMPIHMADLGSDNYELEFTLGLIEGERAILKEIDEALQRLQNGTYGLCQATGKPIGKARLKAKPWAKYCYEYTLAQEQGRTRRL